MDSRIYLRMLKKILEQERSCVSLPPSLSLSQRREKNTCMVMEIRIREWKKGGCHGFWRKKVDRL